MRKFVFCLAVCSVWLTQGVCGSGVEMPALSDDSLTVDMNEVVEDLIEGIRMGLIERKRNVPHLKTFATSGEGDINKASLIGVDYDIEYAQKMLRPHKNLRMIINARAVCESRPLARLMDDALDEVCDKYDLDCQVFFTECFGMADEGR